MNNTYKIIELTGTSNENYEQAVKNAINEASKSLTGLAWFEVVELRGAIKEDLSLEYQAKIKIAFKVNR